MAPKQLIQAFVILMISFLLLLCLQWAYPYIPALNENFKNSNFITYYLNQETAPDTLNLIDSSLLEQLDTTEEIKVEEDSVIAAPDLKQIDSKEIESDSFKVPLYANLDNLKAFFESLGDSSKKRIGYWGDSMIEGDLISQTLRRKLQRKFGGEGVGFVPIISYTAGFRRTITHKFGGGWKYYSLVKTPKKKQAPYGISGEFAYPVQDTSGKSAWVEFKAPKRSKEKWSSVKLFYGKGDGLGTFSFKSNYRSDSLLHLKDTSEFNVIAWKDTGITKVRLQFNKAQNTPLFGFSVETDEGVYVDNFNLRGNSGMPMNRIPYQVMRGFDKNLGYNLIILQFGSNVVSEKTTKYGWYETAITRVIRHYQTSFPGCPILILGLADKSYKNEEGEMVTSPSVKRVLKTQYKVAMKTGVAFYNLYEAMGGENSMVEWVEADKPLANKDYTHFNFRGAETIGSMLFNFLMTNYSEFEKDPASLN